DLVEPLVVRRVGGRERRRLRDEDGFELRRRVRHAADEDRRGDVLVDSGGDAGVTGLDGRAVVAVHDRFLRACPLGRVSSRAGLRVPFTRGRRRRGRSVLTIFEKTFVRGARRGPCFGPTTHVISFPGCPYCPDLGAAIGRTTVAQVFDLCGFPHF